jgi:hypothetical protein
MSDSPSPITVVLSMIRARRVSVPHPTGSATVDHGALSHVLGTLRDSGVPALVEERERIASYRTALAATDPDALGRDEALAYWLNLYNAGALDLAAETHTVGRRSVFRIPGGFQRPWVTVGGETLSLDDIEHGKIRRFGDPRVHAALVCGSASCPTLRIEPYTGSGLGDQLETQMHDFLDGGGVIVAGGRLLLSRIFLWYGPDFARPHRMPALRPVGRRALRRGLSRWLDDRPGSDLPIAFQPYDWSLACAIR